MKSLLTPTKRSVLVVSIIATLFFVINNFLPNSFWNNLFNIQKSAAIFNTATGGFWNESATWGGSNPSPVEGVDYPGASDDVVIKNSTITLYQDANVRDITIVSGGTLDLNGHTINIYGDWLKSGGTLTNNGGTVNFVSTTSDQHILGENTFENLVDVATTTFSLLFDTNATTTVTNSLRLMGSLGNQLHIGASTKTIAPVFSSQFGVTDILAGQLEFPAYIARDSFGNFYVTDSTKSSVHKFDSSGTPILKFGTAGTSSGEFSGPQGIALDSQDNIYVVDSGNNRVQKFSSTTAYLSQFGIYGTGNGEFSGPQGIVIDSQDNIYISDAYNNRIQKFSSTTDYVLQFGSYGTGNGEFSSPQGVAVDSTDYLYVSDSGNRRIQKFDSSGAYQTQFGTSGTGNSQFINQTDIRLDSLDNIYVVDSGNNRVQKFSSTTAYLSQFGTSGSGQAQFSSPQGVVLDDSDNVYVVDKYNSRVQKFDSSDTYQAQFGSKIRSGDGQLNFPTDILIDSSGNIFISDTTNNRVQKFNSSGVYQSQFGSSSPIAGSNNGEFSTPVDIAMDSSDNIYVVDSGNNRVQKFNSSGVYQSYFGTSGTGNGEFDTPTGIAVDSSDNIYIVDKNNNRVQKFNSSGVYQSYFGTSGTGNGEFINPRDIAIDSSGNIFISDTTNNRVQKFDSSGTYISQFSTFNSPAILKIDSEDNIYVVNSTSHYVKKFNKFGGSLFTFGTSGTGDGQFSSPQGIALDSQGNIYVVDSANYRVQKFVSGNISSFKLVGPTGSILPPQFIGDIGTGISGTSSGQFVSPMRVKLDSQGNIYVVDSGNNRVQKFNSAGVYQSQFGSTTPITGTGSGEFSGPKGIAFDSLGNIYIADRNNHRVQKFDSSGNYLLEFGSTTPSNGSGNGEFYYPNDIAIDSSDNIYVIEGGNARVQKFNSAGVYQSNFGSSGSANGEFLDPDGIAIDTQDNIYVSDQGNHRVQKFNSSGVYQSHFGSHGFTEGLFNFPNGISIDYLGNIYVADYGQDRIQKFNSSGVYDSLFVDGLSFPTGVTTDSSGYIYVADQAHNRVKKFAPASSSVIQLEYLSISYSTNSGTTLNCTVGCIDDGNNINWNFLTPQVVQPTAPSAVGAVSIFINKFPGQPSTSTIEATISTTTATTSIPGIDFCFEKNLYPLDQGPDVKKLQIFLNKMAYIAIPKGFENENYGPETTYAVKVFQDFYYAEILSPLGYTSGTGNFGNLTRKKINDILGCPTVFETYVPIKKEPSIPVPEVVQEIPSQSTPTTTETQFIPSIETQQSTGSLSVLPEEPKVSTPTPVTSKTFTTSDQDNKSYIGVIQKAFSVISKSIIDTVVNIGSSIIRIFIN